jgi:hypothetical protein
VEQFQNDPAVTVTPTMVQRDDGKRNCTYRFPTSMEPQKHQVFPLFSYLCAAYAPSG